MPDDCAPRRAAPLGAEERRAAVLTATLPLLRERGTAVSTRDLARAAGVAEGTLFRVFPDKQSLIQAALAQALDPAPLEQALASVDRSLPLEERVRRVVELLSARTDGIVPLLTALHGTCARDGRPHDVLGGEHEARDARILAAVASVLEPDAAALRLPPTGAAALLRGAVLGARMPALSPTYRLTDAELAACLSGGLLATDAGRRDPRRSS